MPNNYKLAVIEQQPVPYPTTMKASGVFTMHGEAEMARYIHPIIKPGPQEIFLMQTRNNL